jgi:hypothetical protein
MKELASPAPELPSRQAGRTRRNELALLLIDFFVTEANMRQIIKYMQNKKAGA